MASSTASTSKLSSRLSRIKHIVLVLSGKGGVGKSSISVQLALSLLAASNDSKTLNIGLLDVDLTGPSIPRMLGLDGHAVHQSNQGWVPVYLNHAQDPAGSNQSTLKVMSIGFLLQDSSQAVVWRGPKKSAMIKQFLADVRWGDLDYLIVDTPPGEAIHPCARSNLIGRFLGTSDEHISLLENLLPALQQSPYTTLSSILVTTPQAVSLSDVSKEYSFTKKVSLPVLGLIENMSGYVCPHCEVIHNIFGKGGGEEFCRLENEKNAKEGNEEKLLFLGRIPVDSMFTQVVEGGGGNLMEKYGLTKSAKLFKEICRVVVESAEQDAENRRRQFEQADIEA